MNAAYVKRTYDITLEEVMEIGEYQGWKCAICGQSLIGRRIEIDHDHRKGLTKRDAVRGLLCGGRFAGCNRKLGRIDKADWLLAAAKYLLDPPAQYILRRDNEKASNASNSSAVSSSANHNGAPEENRAARRV